MKRTSAGLSALVIAPLVTLAATAPAAVAGNPHTVDPAFVTPALTNDFAPFSCKQTGSAIVCTGGREDSYDEDTGIPCGDTTVHVVGHQVIDYTRWHDLQGRALTTKLHTSYDDTLSLTPDGPSVQLFAHWQKHFEYPVPGDESQRVLKETGAILRVRGETGGIIFQDTGFVQYLPGEEYEGVDVMHGVHDRFLGADVDQAICDALLAG